MSRLQEKYFPLTGGEHLNIPAVSVDPGWAMYSEGYELDEYGNYRRVRGYERFDGSLKPSEQSSFDVLDFTDGDAEMTAGDIVTGATSGATGILLYQILESGTYGGGDAAGYLVLTQPYLTFDDDENLQVSAVTEAVADGSNITLGADTDEDYALYSHASITYARDQIAAVPGSGNILGVCMFDGTVYAFRDNAGNTATDMYKSSTSGWTLCTLGYYLDFTSGGTIEIEAGDTIEGETGGATGVVGRVVLTSGTWAGADAAGYFILTSQTGTFESETVKVGANLNLATIASDSTAQTLTKDGRYEFVEYNFGGHTSTKRLYFCNGVDTAFEWDGTVLVPIITGMTTDTPDHIATHRQHLFLSFAGGSVQHSSLNNPPTVVAPYIWSVVTGSGELGMGDEVVGFYKLPGDILCIGCSNSTHLLYGSSSSGDDAWVLKTHDPTSGVKEWSGQLLDNMVVIANNMGLTTLASTDKYGDFISASISEDVKTYLDTAIDSVQCSVVLKSKGQYRLFFTSGYPALFMTMRRGKVLGFTRCSYWDRPVCMWAGQDSAGDEVCFFGDNAGFVYQDDMGRSYDGYALRSVLFLHYNHLGTPGRKKKIHRVFLELYNKDTGIDVSTEDLDLKVAVYFDGGQNADRVNKDVFTTERSEALIETDVATGEFLVGQSGANVGFYFYTNSTYVEPHILQGMTIHYTMRGRKRG